MTLTRREVLDLLSRHGIRPSRALGQNFVVDQNTVRRVARLAGVGPGDRVVEIGAGLGSLTLALAETGAAVVAVELDRYLVPVLRTVVEPAGVRVVEGDALRLAWDEVLGPAAGDGAGSADRPAAADGAPAADHPAASADHPAAADGAPPWVLVANLPYNVATPLLLTLLEQVPAIGRMLVMVQREVGERLAAAPGSGAYGAVSVKVAYRAVAAVVGRVPPTVFVPQPRVESVLVSIERRPAPAVDVDEGRLFALVEAGFAHRRKMLRRALAGVIDPAAFAAAAIAPEARAEELDIHAWGRLTECASSSGPSPS